jgi:hypothetical protein
MKMNIESSDQLANTVEMPSSSSSDEHPESSIGCSPASGIQNRRRTGAIARLPRVVRQQVNEMLDDGHTYKAIIAAVGDVGLELNEDMMSRWKQGGYQDYLREQQLLEQCRMRTNRAFELMASPNSVNGFQATQQLAAAQICEAVAELGPDVLRQALTANPLNYFRMLNSFSRLANGGIRCEQHLTHDAERQAEIQARNAPPEKKVLSDKTAKGMI